MHSTEVPSTSSDRRSISSLSKPGLNPYLDLLYSALSNAGIPIAPAGSMRLRWLVAQRREVRYLHVNWPEGLYRVHRGALRLRPYFGWLKLALLAARLRIARALGYKLVWTIHQVHPHDSAARLDRAGARLLARNAYLLLAHDPETAARARREFELSAAAIEIVPHGSYVDVYAAGRTRQEVRRALGIDEEAVVFLCFGELRADSELATLLDAFAQLRLDAGVLVIAGNAKNRHMRALAAAAAAADDRILRIDGFVPFEGVRELYDAADVAVVPRANGGTSGSLILALSLGTPVVGADMPAYRRLLDDGAAGWLFRPGDAADLCSALEAAAGDEAARNERGAAARRIAAALDWRDTATQIAALLRR